MDAKILAQAVEDVFLTMLNLEVSLSEKTADFSPGRLMSVVYLSGPWNGAVIFECDRLRACQFAGHFLSIDTPQAVTEEVRDVLRELANMIGGNMKSVVGTGLRLSLPSVLEETESASCMGEGVVQDRLAFDTQAGPFWVTLLLEKTG